MYIEIFYRFGLTQIPWIDLHNQLALTKFGRRLLDIYVHFPKLAWTGSGINGIISTNLGYLASYYFLKKIYIACS